VNTHLCLDPKLRMSKSVAPSYVPSCYEQGNIISYLPKTGIPNLPLNHKAQNTRVEDVLCVPTLDADKISCL
jgi:hypothetical protein